MELSVRNARSIAARVGGKRDGVGVIGRVQRMLGGDRGALAAQILRYAVAGVGISVFQIGLYNILAGPARIAPLLANTVAYLVALCIGYVVHSRFSFAGHGSRANRARTGGRFVTASLIGFAMNSVWVWSMTGPLHWPDWTPSLPMFFVTPLALFLLNRYWVFE